MKIRVKNFDLKNTIEAGQLFNYSQEGGFYYLIHNGSVIKIRQTGNTLEFYHFPRKNDLKSVKKLLNFDKDYFPVIKKYFSNRSILSSYREFSGVRITAQDPWECLLGFMCSQMNNIPRIRKMIACLSYNLGKKVRVEGNNFHLFPTPKQMENASAEKLENCRLGYRREYIIRAARAVNSGFAFGKLRSLEYEDAKRGLMMLFGIGGKVADCILVFSLGFAEGFPVDIWIKKIMQNLYFEGKNVPESKIAEFARRKFGKDAAVVHEFLYANRKNLV